MIKKQIEEYLIDNDFIYVKELSRENISYLKHKKHTHIYVSLLVLDELNGYVSCCLESKDNNGIHSIFERIFIDNIFQFTFLMTRCSRSPLYKITEIVH